MKLQEFLKFLEELEKNIQLDAYVSYFAKKIKNPEERLFKVTVSTILSARTKDETTAKISENLFKKVKNWEDLRTIDMKELENLIYGVGFYKNKAKMLKKLAEKLKELNDTLPSDLEDLIKLPGIGTKTANIILVDGFNKEGLAVDTHVHRIVNRFELVDTFTPEETEKELKKLIPKEKWNKVNALLVSFGRQICNVKPNCKKCFFRDRCPYYKKLTRLNDLLENFKFKELPIKKIDELDDGEKGTYILKVFLKENSKIKDWNLKKGYYFYVGSAKNGLRNRLIRHLSKNKKLFWHIDYLLSNKNSRISKVYISNLFIEKEVAKEFSKILKPIPNFGNSDDKENLSHLFYLQP